MRVKNKLINDLAAIPEIRSFSKDLKQDVASALFLTSHAAVSCFIAAISLSNKLVAFSDDAFGLYHDSLGIKRLSFDYLPPEDNPDIVPKIFNDMPSSRLRSYLFLKPFYAPNIIYTDQSLDIHVELPYSSKNDKFEYVKNGSKISPKDLAARLNEKGYTESFETKFYGEYTRRGGIVDVFPPNTINPIRIELYGNTVESVRFYNPTSQLTLGVVNKVYLPSINNVLNVGNTITYENAFIDNGYKIIYVYKKTNSCTITNFDRADNGATTTYKIKSKPIKFDELTTKYRSNISTLFIVGGYKKDKLKLHKNTNYIDGWINGNIIIDKYGICLMSGKKNTNRGFINKNNHSEEYYDYNWGDYVSHVDFGIGIYRGLITKNNKDYINIEYANNATVHISAQRFDMIAPLIGVQNPKVNNISGGKWTTIKTKTRHKIRDVIAEMVKINQNRSSRREFQYKKDDYLEKEIAGNFPHVETNDQAKAIDDIYGDMKKPGLMDRLIIGDVGYGKTEVALRAAAKAAFSDVFVMLVAPTTILADQHYILFKNRLENYGINVEMLSRFVTKTTQDKIIKKIEDKQVDILVGTHKLLSDNINKINLGLLIIDDEHKFGVIHKNKLLKIKRSVDVLTLTATPIPRTLQQSLLGLKSVSLINTPPVNRIPIKTRIIKQNWEFIKSIIEKEIYRGGQVYFLNNRIQSIPFYERKIQKMLPNLTIASAHGGMKSRDLERTVFSFFEGKIQILISTTIIESGLDVPNANTIIIASSHNFGLSQLYQVRGRVGRGDRQGFCYLVLQNGVILSDEAIERLKTIQNNSDLGSGYKIAQKDLEIRGAGNVFGYEQSGHISKVGYNLYCKMFNEELSRSKGSRPMGSIPKINYFGDAALKEGYVPLSQDRLYYYQRLSSAKNNKSLSVIKKEIKDRFGSPDTGAKNLFKITALRIRYTNTLINKIIVEKNKTMLTLKEIKQNAKDIIDLEKLMKALEKAKVKYVFKQKNKASFGLEIISMTGEDPLKALMRYAEIFYYDDNNT